MIDEGAGMVRNDMESDTLIIKAETAIERLQEYRTASTNTAVTGRST